MNVLECGTGFWTLSPAATTQNHRARNAEPIIGSANSLIYKPRRTQM